MISQLTFLAMRFRFAALLGFAVLLIGSIAIAVGTLHVSRVPIDRDLPNDNSVLQDFSFIERAVGKRETIAFVVTSENPIERTTFLDICEKAFSFAQYPGVWFTDCQPSANDRAVLVPMEIDATLSDEILAMIPSMRRALESVGVGRVLLTGREVLVHDIQNGIARDLMLLLPLSFGLMFFVFWMSFRKIMLAIGAFFLLATVVALMFAGIGAFGIGVSLILMLTPLILIAFGGPYIVYLFVHFQDLRREGANPLQALTSALHQSAWPVLWGSAIAAVGFATLGTFPITTIRTFGIVTSIGTVLTALFALGGGSAVLMMFGTGPVAPKQGTVRKIVGLIELAIDKTLGAFAASIARFSSTYPILVTGVVIAVSIFVLVGLPPKVGSDLIAYFPSDHEARAADKILRSSFGGAASMVVLLDGKTEGIFTDPQEIIAFQEYVGALQTNPDIGIVIPQWEKLGDPFDESYRYALLRIRLRSTESNVIRSVREMVLKAGQSHLPGITIATAGDMALAAEQDDVMIRGQVNNIIASVIIALLVCIFAFRALRFGVLAPLPFILATVLTFGAMGWLGISLTMATALITGIAVGIGLDFGLHFLDHARKTKACTPDDFAEIGRTTGKPILIDAIATIAAFLVYLFSSFPPIKELGILIALMTAGAAATALVLLPALARLFARYPQPKEPA